MGSLSPPESYSTFDNSTWSFPMNSGIKSDIAETLSELPKFEDHKASKYDTTMSYGYPHQAIQFVQPSDVQKSPSIHSTDLSSDDTSPIETLLANSFPITANVANQFRLSSLTLQNDSIATPADGYRPRQAPVRHRKGTSRITPRSEKHARELELNRKAATKCRNRQKAYVENLQERARKEEQKMQVQANLVQSLHDEVMMLRNEVLKQSFCGCSYLKDTVNAVGGLPKYTGSSTTVT